MITNKRLQQIIEDTLYLEIKNVNSREHLLLINDDITDYEKQFGFDLKMYRKCLIEMGKEYK
ncbi:hypothetical protein LCGC14_3128690 [marine sediment metagenome]|uniref:Uncharacterized protein n=1 Tax=marine sediment metagenome TaxID=412755 RepID=A0A0F8YPS1_9ZZZZ